MNPNIEHMVPEGVGARTFACDGKRSFTDKVCFSASACEHHSAMTLTPTPVGLHASGTAGSFGGTHSAESFNRVVLSI